jgi:PAS domain S-box-containing protein
LRRELYLLNVSESAAEAAEISRLLQDASYEIHADHVASAEQLGAVFAATGKHEVVIVHHPTAPAQRDVTLKILQDYATELPCIVIGHKINAETVEFMKAGACDFVLRSEVARIGAVVDAALNKAPRSATHDRLKNALRLSEEKYDCVFRISPDSINLNRLEDGVYVDVNDGFTRILGYTREEVLGRSARPADLGIWINDQDCDRLVAGLKANGEVIGLEAPFRRKDGRVVYGLMSAHIMQIDGVDCVISHTREITARRQMEEELRKLSRAVEQSPSSIVITDLMGTIEYVNGGFTRTTGYSAEEVRGRKTNILKSGSMPPSTYEKLWRTISVGGEWHGEFHNQKKNGELFWEDATVSAIKDSAGHITHFLAIKEDITSRKQVEQGMADALTFNRTLVESSPVGVITYNAAGDAVSANEAAARTVGTTVENIKKQNFRKLESWQKSGLRAAAELALASGLEQQLETHTRSTYGRDIWVSAQMVPFHFNGQLHLLGIFAEITARKEAEQAREATIRLLYLCNQASDTRTLGTELKLFFKELTGCEAVGLRLRDSADFPCSETRASAGESAQAEIYRCAYNKSSESECDDAGPPSLADVCRRVLAGRSDPSKPYFSEQGSFWTNSITGFLATTTEAEGQARIQNRCQSGGYESVALIPLRHQTHTLGLLQFNDRRKGMFTKEKIAFFEGLAEYITVALMKLESDRALRSSEEHLRVVLDTSEAGYFFIDPAGVFQRVNTAWLRMHGYEHAGEIIGKHFSHTQAEPDQQKAATVVAQLFAGAKIPAGEFSRRRKDGSLGYHTFSAHVVREAGSIVGIEGFLIDTTSLRQIRSEYQMLFEQMLDGFALHEMVFDPAGSPVDYRFLAVNPAFERMTGLKAAEVIGKTVLTVMPKTEHKWIELYGEVVRTGVPKRFEDFAKVLGKHFEVLAFRPQQGQFACIIQDVTNRKQLELQLLQAQKMEAIGQLAGGVAHDFNNILAATMMHLSLLQRVPELTLSMKESLKELEAETKRATGLTRQLLLFSRRQVLHTDTIDLNELLSTLLKMLRRLIGEHINLVFKPGLTPLWIEADAGMIEQVVMNLCVNARDAMTQGGRVTIGADSLTLDSTKTLGDTETRSGEFICLSVTDTGCGMDAATLKHIFEPFFTTKEAGKGTGLGLATVYGIVKQHRGWINVHSALGNGSTFRIFLPATTAPTPVVNESRGPSQIKGGGESVLVVEDDEAFRNMMAMTLKVLGYRVFEAADGRAALGLWEKYASEISFLFTDQVMPGGISGLDLCRRLHATKPTLRRMISTGYTTSVIDPAVLAAEGIDFLPKPFTSESLANAVRKCIDRTEHAPLGA